MDHVGGRHQVSTGVARRRVRRQGNIGIEPGQQDLHAGHERRDYPGPVSDSAAGKALSKTGYTERLYVTWYWWLLPLLAAGLLAAEVHLGYPGVRAWLPYVLLLPLTALLILRAGARRYEVEDGELRVGDAHVPLEHVGESRSSTPRTSARCSVADSTRRRSCCTAGGCGPLVRVEVTDPDDPTPYWVFSHPASGEGRLFVAWLKGQRVARRERAGPYVLCWLLRRSRGRSAAARCSSPACCGDAPGSTWNR